MPDVKDEEATPDFDAIYLGHSSEFGGDHLATMEDVKRARRDEGELLLSQEVEKFCNLIVLHGFLPSAAYTQAFIKADDYGQLIQPDHPAYRSRMLLRLPEVKDRIEDLRAEVVAWGKTSFEELEMNLRSIALNPTVKDSDRISASKALSAMRGFDAVPEGLMAGATIQINMPFALNNLQPQAGNIIDVKPNKQEKE